MKMKFSQKGNKKISIRCEKKKNKEEKIVHRRNAAVVVNFFI